MGRYHARDLVRVPGLLSLSRLPLAAVFPLTVGRPPLAFGVLVAAGLSDVADGWYARRFKQATATGAALDPVTDKLFVLTVAVTLLVTQQLTALSVVLLSTREIGELPLVLWLALSHDARRKRAEQPSANAAGKAATALQFASVTVALFHAPHGELWVGATAVAGAVAALTYWQRALRAGEAKKGAS
jgi:cardiolipin synthase